MKKNHSQTTSSLIPPLSYLNQPSSLKRKTNTRFTLIELLIVIAIIAILASMILPALRSALDKTKAISCTSNQKQLATATFLYVDDNKGFLPYNNFYYSSAATSVKWATVLWSYTTHEPITSDFTYLKSLSGGMFEPKNNMFRCPAVLEPIKLSVEGKHIGGNNYFFSTPYAPNLFITKCRWPSTRMLYADYYSNSSYDVQVTVSKMTYLHPGLTATVTHLDGHVKAWNMHAVPKESWNSRFWGGNLSCTGEFP